MKIITILFTILFLNSLAYADKNMKIGSKGKETDVTRVIKVVMYDNITNQIHFRLKRVKQLSLKLKMQGCLFMNLILQTK